MLPPWQALAGFICLAALFLVGIDHLNAPRGTTSFQRPRLGALVLPLAALIVLLLPYLPVVPDRWPVLQALAGPLAAIVWLVGGGPAGVGAVAIALDHRAHRSSAGASRSLTVAIFVGTTAVAGIAANRLTGTVLFPVGR